MDDNVNVALHGSDRRSRPFRLPFDIDASDLPTDEPGHAAHSSRPTNSNTFSINNRTLNITVSEVPSASLTYNTSNRLELLGEKSFRPKSSKKRKHGSDHSENKRNGVSALLDDMFPPNSTHSEDEDEMSLEIESGLLNHSSTIFSGSAFQILDSDDEPEPEPEPEPVDDFPHSSEFHHTEPQIHKTPTDFSKSTKPFNSPNVSSSLAQSHANELLYEDPQSDEQNDSAPASPTQSTGFRFNFGPLASFIRGSMSRANGEESKTAESETAPAPKATKPKKLADSQIAKTKQHSTQNIEKRQVKSQRKSTTESSDKSQKLQKPQKSIRADPDTSNGQKPRIKRKQTSEMTKNSDSISKTTSKPARAAQGNFDSKEYVAKIHEHMQILHHSLLQLKNLSVDPEKLSAHTEDQWFKSFASRCGITQDQLHSVLLLSSELKRALKNSDNDILCALSADEFPWVSVASNAKLTKNTSSTKPSNEQKSLFKLSMDDDDTTQETSDWANGSMANPAHSVLTKIHGSSDELPVAANTTGSILFNARTKQSEVSFRFESYDPGVSYPPNLPVINNKALYNQAFTHSSMVTSMVRLSDSQRLGLHNERLEFVGDSILGSIITPLVFERFSTCPEGDLHNIRVSLVNNEQLIEWALLYGFDKRLEVNITENAIEYSNKKIFADVFEAYIGALAVDRDFDLRCIKKWIEALAEPILVKHEARIHSVPPLRRDAKQVLNNLIATDEMAPKYELVVQGDGLKVATVVQCKMGSDTIGIGVGKGVREAGIRAAMEALEHSDELLKIYGAGTKRSRVKGKFPLLLNHMSTQEGLQTVKAAVGVGFRSLPELPYGNPSDENNTGDSEDGFEISNNPFQKTTEQSIMGKCIGEDESECVRAPMDQQILPSAKNELYAYLGTKKLSPPEYDCIKVKFPTLMYKCTIVVCGTAVAYALGPTKKIATGKAASFVIMNRYLLDRLIDHQRSY